MTDVAAIPVLDLTTASSGALLRRRIMAHRGLLTGTGLLTLIILVALLAPLLAPHDPYAQDLSRRMIPPIWYEKSNWAHLLGTDNLGRDYLSRVLYGAQISLLIGVSVMVISGLIGTALGLAAGFFGGRVDMIVTFFITVRLALPLILVALAVVATVGGSLWVVILVLGLLKWDRFAVVMRAATQQVRVLDYVAAAEAAGASTLRVVVGEVLPNLLPQLVVVATVEAASAILLEAALSFLGLGVQPPLTSLGNMVGYGREYIERASWILLSPAVVIVLTTLSISLIGDWLRDRLDPTLR